MMQKREYTGRSHGIDQSIKAFFRHRHHLRHLLVQRFHETALLHQIRCHDHHAIAKLYERYADYLHREVLMIVRDDIEAEDLLQELFLQIWEKPEDFDSSKGSVFSWLTTLARNRAIDRIRSKSFRTRSARSRDLPVELLPADDAFSPFDHVVRSERYELLLRAISSLPPAQREVIRWAYWGGYTQKQMKEHFHLPLGTVKTRMRQGLKRLQLLLRHYGRDVGA